MDARRNRGSVAKRPCAEGAIPWIGVFHPARSQRCSAAKFLLWLAPWAALLRVRPSIPAGLCLVKGLNQTHMNNRFAFGLWIFLDLTVIALGAGAFFTGLSALYPQAEGTAGGDQ